MARHKWNCLFIHDSHRCINMCLLECRDNILRRFSPSASLRFYYIHWPAINSIRPPPMIDLSMIIDRPCLHHITVCRPLMTLMIDRHFVKIDISDNDMIVCIKNSNFYINLSIDFCVVNFLVERTTFCSLQYIPHLPWARYSMVLLYCTMVLTNYGTSTKQDLRTIPLYMLTRTLCTLAYIISYGTEWSLGALT
jgi:hypothetical protein